MSTEEQLYYQKLSKPHKGRGAQQRHVEKFRLKKNEEVQSLIDNYIDFAKSNLFSSLSCTSFVDTGLYNNKIKIKTRNYTIQHPIDQEYIESLKPYIDTFNLASESTPMYATIQRCPPISDHPIIITRYQQCTRGSSRIQTDGLSVSLDKFTSISLCSSSDCCCCRDYPTCCRASDNSHSFIKNFYNLDTTSMTYRDFPPLPVGVLPIFGLDCIVILSPRAYNDKFNVIGGRDGIYSTNHVAFESQFIPDGSVLFTDRYDVYLHAYRSRCYGIIHCPPSEHLWCNSVKRYPGYHFITSLELADFLAIYSSCWDCIHGLPHYGKRLYGVQFRDDIKTNSSTVNSQTILDKRQSAWKSI